MGISVYLDEGSRVSLNDQPFWYGGLLYASVSNTLKEFDRAAKDAADFIRKRRALPSLVWIGSQYLSLADFTATLAGDDGRSPEVEVRKCARLFEKHFAIAFPSRDRVPGALWARRGIGGGDVNHFSRPPLHRMARRTNNR